MSDWLSGREENVDFHRIGRVRADEIFEPDTSPEAPETREFRPPARTAGWVALALVFVAGVLAVMGPKSRDLLAAVSPHDWSSNNHPFGWAHEIEIGLGNARAHRVSYVGELGWELYVSADQAAHIFETIAEAGEDYGLKMVGMPAKDVSICLDVADSLGITLPMVQQCFDAGKAEAES